MDGGDPRAAARAEAARVAASAGGRRVRDHLPIPRARGSWRVVAKAWRPTDPAADAG